MVDQLRTTSKAAQTIIGGAAGGVAYQATAEGIWAVFDLLLPVFFVLAVAYYLLEWYYQRQRGEPLS